MTAWRHWVPVPDWYFWENQGAGVAVADLDGDGTPEIVVLAVDNPQVRTGATTAWAGGSSGGRPVDGWGPWQPVTDWGYWEGQDAAAAIASLDPRVSRTWSSSR